MRLAGLLALVVVALVACGSFDAATDAPTADGGANANDGGGSGEGAAKTGCPEPAAPNTMCWDFDDGALPTGSTKLGDFAFDTSSFVSPSRALAVSTRDVPMPDEGWARLEHVVAGAPKSITLEQQLRIKPAGYVELSDIVVRGDGSYYRVFFVFDDGAFEVIEATFVNNDTPAYQKRALGSIASDAFHSLSLRSSTFPDRRRSAGCWSRSTVSRRSTRRTR